MAVFCDVDLLLQEFFDCSLIQCVVISAKVEVSFLLKGLDTLEATFGVREENRRAIDEFVRDVASDSDLVKDVGLGF